jgi:hypothetical protein
LSSTDNSITDIELVDTDELEKTYRIHFTNGNHFDYVVKDGKDGKVEKTWISLVSSWTAEPTIHSTENDYDVWEYTY